MKLYPSLKKHLERIILLLLFSMIGHFSFGQTWTVFETNGEMQARIDNAFMACNGKFYMLGGRGLQPVSIFDPATQSWTQGTAPPVEMHHFQAVRYGDRIYVMGAFTGIYPYERPLEHIYIYDTNTDTWEKGDPIPEDRRRGSAGVVVYRGKFYMICGTRDRYKGSHTNWVDRYDPATGKWKKMTKAPHTRDNFHAGMINGKIYAAGGRNTSRYSGTKRHRTIAEVDVYDIESGRWTTLPESLNLPTPRAGCSTVAIMDHLLVIGGENMNQEEAYDIVEAYDVERGVWETWGNLQQGRQGTQAFMCVGTVFIASGRGLRDGGTPLSTIEKLEF